MSAKFATIAVLTALSIASLSQVAKAAITNNGMSIQGIKNPQDFYSTSFTLSNSKFSTIEVEGGRLVGIK